MSERRVSWSLVLLAITVRVAAVLVLQSHTVPRSTYEHGEIAANLLAGRGFSVKFLGADGPTSQQAPVYPMLVAAAYAIGGVEAPRALLLLELGQGVLGGLLVLAVLMLCGEVAPGKIWFGRLAGFAAAVHPTLVYAATHVQVALLAATLFIAALAWGFRLARTGSLRDAVVAGFVLGLLALTDPILGFAVIGVGCAVVAERGFLRSLRPLAVLAMVAVIAVAPWIVRNARVHGEFVPIKSTFGYAFWQGNSALSEGTDKVRRASVEQALNHHEEGLSGLNRSLWAARHEAGYLDDIALTAADYRELSQLSEPARSRRLFRRALDDLRADPARYPTLCLRRLRYFLLFDETNPKTRNTIYRVSQLGITAWAIMGLVLAGPQLRRRLIPTFLTAGLIVLFHTLTITSVRFHIPLEPLMAIWGAAGFARWTSPAPADDVEDVVVERRLAVRGSRVLVGLRLPGGREQLAGQHTAGEHGQ